LSIPDPGKAEIVLLIFHDEASAARGAGSFNSSRTFFWVIQLLLQNPKVLVGYDVEVV
jgi:hypothetical protein